MAWAEGYKLQGDKYVIQRVLGEGGFGITYLAHHSSLDCPVVIKTPNDKLQNDPNYPKFKEKFLREARLLAKLTQQRHPHIVAVQDLFEEGGLPCLVMGYVRGQTLFEVVQARGALPEQEALAYVRQIGDALKLVHEQGLVHRDAHPGNVMVTPQNQVMLIDFGLAREVVPNASTQALNVAFAPWEQMTGVVKPTIDVYTVSASLYFLVTGKVPTPCLHRKMAGQGLLAPQQHVPQLSGWLSEAIVQGMALEPEKRPQTMAKFLQLLKAPAPKIFVPKMPVSKESASIQVPLPRKPTKLLTVHEPQSPFSLEQKSPTQGGLALKRFQFETVQVNAKGEIVKRIQGEAEKFEEDLGNGVLLEMVRIPAGMFVMGSSQDEKGRRDSEGPQHQVRVPEFWMGRFVITQVQYESIVGKNPSHFQGKQHPVERVSWNDAVAFCKQLSAKSGKRYRLPSEAEWEYACRAGTETPFHFGPTLTADLANYCGTFLYAQEAKGRYARQTVAVSRFPPNAFGLYDMHGNVWEWCSDRRHSNYKGVPADGSSWTQKREKESYMLRGGAWFDNPRDCRSACRDSNRPSIRTDFTGFRVCCSAPRT